jgi:hypothetical protein
MSVARRGRRPGAGRKAGGRNKSTIEREIRAAHDLEAAQNYDLLPLDVLLARMRNEPLPTGHMVTDQQFQAAVAAALFLHPRLSAGAYQKPPSPIKIDVSALTSEERKTLLAAIRRGFIRQIDDSDADNRVIDGEALPVAARGR